jgi:hypothetical protein
MLINGGFAHRNTLQVFARKILPENGIGSLGFVHFYDDFNGILDPLTLIFYGGRQVLKRKRMRVDDGCVKLALGHQGHGAVGGAAAFPANTENARPC